MSSDSGETHVNIMWTCQHGTQDWVDSQTIIQAMCIEYDRTKCAKLKNEHESSQYYKDCEGRDRNKGEKRYTRKIKLFIY